MNKISIIGLGLVGNSIGMAIKRAAVEAIGEHTTPLAQGVRITGFDPSREREAAALRRYNSVDEIAPDLRRAVQGAELVVLSTPASAVREVMEAIAPFLEEGTTVTDTLPAKEQVMSWAGELFGPGIGFVGGHPMSTSMDLALASDEAMPSPDLFYKAHYCILPAASAGNEAMNRVIWLAEIIGAQPLFIDTLEHDSFVAAASQLPALASANLLRITAGGTTWSDMSVFAGEHYDAVSEPLEADPERLTEGLLANRQALVRWLDQYILSMHELREMLAASEHDALLDTLQRAHTAQASHANRNARDNELRTELRQAIQETHPVRGLLGGYISDRVFRKREGK
ncbi:MAG: prephenate dehydrogenase [Chloroflexia bacterium]|jgi:prephenate dehydrogenase|nr:prephenate dehydrogenase [Chloroflexia bacterium]